VFSWSASIEDGKPIPFWNDGKKGNSGGINAADRAGFFRRASYLMPIFRLAWHQTFDIGHISKIKCWVNNELTSRSRGKR
jgi:hypothetical protein